jgi:hypothetical protein
MSQELLDILLPCKDCLCLPCCRHKDFRELFKECDILYRYEPNSCDMTLRNQDRLFLLQKIMKPSTWGFGYDPADPADPPQKYACLYFRSNIPLIRERLEL